MRMENNNKFSLKTRVRTEWKPKETKLKVEET